MYRRNFIQSSIAASVGSALPNQMSLNAASGAPLNIGLVADPQYADIDTWNTRFYRQSIDKLNQAVEHFNQHDLSFCVNLGDLIDKHWQSYDAIFAPLAKAKHKFHHVLGNHDFDLLDEFKSRVPDRLGMTKRYYSIAIEQWQFVFLDTTDVSLYAQPENTKPYSEADEELKRLKSTGAKNAQSWNSAISQLQLDWFDETCKTAAKQQQRVIVFSHHPVFPANEHNTWNSTRILEVVTRNRNVVAWLNGHNHAGNFGVHNDVPFVTLQGMVETKDANSFAVAKLHQDRLELVGHGREQSRELLFRTT